MYTANHKNVQFILTTTLANLNRCFNSFYIVLIAKKFYMRL